MRAEVKTQLKDVGVGARGVVTALACAFSTALFLPGVLMKVGVELAVARSIGREIQISGFLREFGGEVESEEKVPWTRFLVLSSGVLYGLGVVLLLPTIFESSVLDVRPFAAVSANTHLVVSRDTHFLPLYDMLTRLGTAHFMRLWFGVSALVCSLPASAVLEHALDEQRARHKWSPARLAMAGPLAVLRLLSLVDQLVSWLLVSGYLVSGLLVAYLSWRLLSVIMSALFGSG